MKLILHQATLAITEIDFDQALFASRIEQQHLRPTPASVFLVFHSGSGMRKIVFQVIQYKPFQILVESFVAERVATSPSVFHFRIRTSFQVPGFEWVHELLLLCLTSNSAQFCAEIACGKTGLGHNCTDSRFRIHRESVSGLGGFSLGFVYRCARRVGSGLYQSASILYHLTTARRWRSGDTQRFGVLYSKFEFAVQDAIKTPQAKATPTLSR